MDTAAVALNMHPPLSPIGLDKRRALGSLLKQRLSDIIGRCVIISTQSGAGALHARVGKAASSATHFDELLDMCPMFSSLLSSIPRTSF